MTRVNRPLGWLLLFILLLASLLAGCAGKMERLMSGVGTVHAAKAQFGNPTSTSEQPDGSIRYDWVKERTISEPGHFETRCVRIKHDDGIPECVKEEVWVPAILQHNDCRITILADRQGRVLHSSWQGDLCRDMNTLR